MKEEIESTKMEIAMNPNKIGDQTFTSLKKALEEKGFYVEDDGLIINETKYPGIALEIDTKTLEIGENTIDINNIKPTASLT